MALVTLGVVGRRAVRLSSETKLLIAALAAWTAVAVANLVAGPPLGHDEAAFAVLARDGRPDWLYRSSGVSALADVGTALGGTEWQLRLASAVLGLGTVLAAFAIGRAVFSASTGAWAAAVIAGAHPMVLRDAELLGDLPATAAVVAGMAVVAGELARPDGLRWRIVLAAPLFATAFYFRYGSAPVIAVVALAALVLWWRPIRARPLPVVVTSIALAALLVPHFARSLRDTGSLFGVLAASSAMPRLAYWGEGLVTYVTSNPFSYYGALVAPLVIAALVGLRRTLRNRAAWFVAIVALGQVLALGIESHAQPRYIFIATALLVVLGVETVRPLARPRLALAACGAAWLAIAAATIPHDRAVAHHRAPLVSAGRAIRADHIARTSPGCGVFAEAVPQIMWYSDCPGVLIHNPDFSLIAAGADLYVVSTPDAPVDGPAFAASRGMHLVELPTGDPRSRVWAVR